MTNSDDVEDEELAELRHEAEARLGDHVGRYRLLRVLGIGGMATVYEVEDERIGFHAAMKLLHGRFARRGDLVARFAEEAKARKAVGHAGVVQVTDFGEDSNAGPFLVMELLTGQTLREWMTGRAPQEVLPIVIGALEPLAAAHARGIVHRDIKPENIFVKLAESGHPTGVKLLDFGIARLPVQGGGDDRGARVRRTRTGMSFGTLAYISPEQARSARGATTASDVWSIGVILFEILTGEHPIGMKTTGEIYEALFSPQPLPRVRTVASHLPVEWQRLTDLCVDKVEDERPTVEELLEVIPALLDQVPIASGPPPLGSPPKRPMGLERQPASTARVLSEKVVDRSPVGSEAQSPTGTRPRTGAAKRAEAPTRPRLPELPSPSVSEVRPELDRVAPVSQPRRAGGYSSRRLRLATGAALLLALGLTTIVVGYWTRRTPDELGLDVGRLSGSDDDSSVGPLQTDLPADERQFGAGQRLLENGNAQAAYEQFMTLPVDSPLRSRPQVGQAARTVASADLVIGQDALSDRECEYAVQAADRILAMEGITPAQREQALRLRADGHSCADGATVGGGGGRRSGPPADLDHLEGLEDL